MAPNNEENLLAWAQEIRGVETLQAEPSFLEKIRVFLTSREAESAKVATHTVLENYPDWWVNGRRAPPGLDVQGSEDLKELYRCMGALFSLGIPLTLAERRTTAFRLFQDVEAWGTREAAIPMEDLIGTDTALTRLIGTVIGEVFPGHAGFLDVAVFDATGLSQTKGVRKTSVRLVWPGIVVDSDRAARVRDLLVHRLAAASKEEGPIADLEARLKGLSSSNLWHSVIGDAAYASRANVRMPLCDRVSPLPLRAPEHRPLAPVGVIRFTFGSDGKMHGEWLCRQGELDDAEWIKIGALRQPEEAQLTEWSVPAWQGSQPVPPSSTRTGRVKVRTAGGSDGGGGLRLRATKVSANQPERAGQLLTVERCFTSDADQFCEKMDEHLGKAMVEPDGAFVWKQPGGDARIVLYADDKRVKVVGRPNQVRSLVVIVAPFTEEAPGLGLSATGPTATRQQGPGPLPDGRLPSAAFSPPDAGAGTWASGDSEVAAAGQNSEQQQGALPPEGQQRVAKEDFEPQGQGELALTRGEAIHVTHDPEGEHGNGQDRWVYGCAEASGQCGWFPLSHTVPIDEWQAD